MLTLWTNLRGQGVRSLRLAYPVLGTHHGKGGMVLSDIFRLCIRVVNEVRGAMVFHKENWAITTWPSVKLLGGQAFPWLVSYTVLKRFFCDVLILLVLRIWTRIGAKEGYCSTVSHVHPCQVYLVSSMHLPWFSVLTLLNLCWWSLLQHL